MRADTDVGLILVLGTTHTVHVGSPRYSACRAEIGDTGASDGGRKLPSDHFHGFILSVGFSFGAER